MNRDACGLALAVRHLYGSPRQSRLTASMPSNVTVLAFGIGVRREGKVVRVPPNGERDVHAPVRQVCPPPPIPRPRGWDDAMA